MNRAENKALSIYLHDHHGAAKVAVDLLSSWKEDDSTPSDLRQFADRLGKRVEQDRETLRAIIDVVGNPKHDLKEAAGWLAQKFSHLKIARKDLPELGRLEGLEMLALGVLGKLALWKSLATVAGARVELARFNFPRLAEDARAQYSEVEAWRITAASVALLFE